MENRDFFDTITEYIEEEKGWSRASLEAFTTRCGYEKACLDEYDDRVEYRRILLSFYYHSSLYDHELDFDGKPFGHPGSDEPTRHLEEIMRRRESVKSYVVSSMSFSSYRELVEEYNLAT